MFFFTLFFFELFILFLTSKALTGNLFAFFHYFTRSKKVASVLMALLFFPGTLLHELSHLFMALLLFVPVGEMEFIPKLEGENLKLGSVAIAKTDPFRRFLIGVAPFLFGAALLLGGLFYAASNHLFTNTIFIALMLYGAFEIGNTMFSSRKDLEGALEFLGALFFIILVVYFLGLRLPNFHPGSILANPLIQETLRQGALFLLIPLIIDSILLLLMRMLFRNR